MLDHTTLQSTCALAHWAAARRAAGGPALASWRPRVAVANLDARIAAQVEALRDDCIDLDDVNDHRYFYHIRLNKPRID